MAEQRFRIEIDPELLVPSVGVRKYYFLSLGLVGLMGVALVVIWRYLPEVVPMLFTEPWGEARLVPKLYLGGLPLMGMVIVVVNVLIGKAVTVEQRALIYALGVGTLLFNVILMIAMYGIVQSLL